MMNILPLPLPPLRLPLHRNLLLNFLTLTLQARFFSPLIILLDFFLRQILSPLLPIPTLRVDWVYPTHIAPTCIALPGMDSM